MPGSPHPIDVLLIDGVEVSKAAWRADERLGHIRVVEDVQEIRDTDFTGHFAGLRVRSLDSNFRLDTGDVQADDGVNVIIDAAGNHFLREAIPAPPLIQTVYTAVGDITLDENAPDTVVVKKTVGAATTVFMPDAADFLGERIRIVDGKGDAATNNISVAPKAGSGQTILGTAGIGYVIDSNFSSLELEALADGTGWI